MKGRFLVSSNEDPAEGNVYADKSSLVLDWLLREGLSKESFSLREVAQRSRGKSWSSSACFQYSGIERTSAS